MRQSSFTSYLRTVSAHPHLAKPSAIEAPFDQDQAIRFDSPALVVKAMRETAELDLDLANLHLVDHSKLGRIHCSRLNRHRIYEHLD